MTQDDFIEELQMQLELRHKDPIKSTRRLLIKYVCNPVFGLTKVLNGEELEIVDIRFDAKDNKIIMEVG